MEKINNRDFISIKGANENNLKNISLVIPKNKLVVFTGLSGSGKSSLAFNTIYEEGRRRYVDSLSSYARQFLGGTKKPNVDSIEGLSPSISIEQKTTHSNPRSTVGTITEVHDYLRLLFAKIGKPYCPTHKIEVSSQRIKDIIDSIFKIKEGSKLLILSPIAKKQKGTNKNLFNKLRQDGFLRVQVDGNIYSLDDEINIEKN
ncbi:MAG: excinuclease ABC subunit UvrA, partial [Mycoplasmataceae bacterium]|nr:excinuclease ABC subunit UvrA [Mycoplasmataceae bacterium]